MWFAVPGILPSIKKPVCLNSDHPICQSCRVDPKYLTTAGLNWNLLASDKTCKLCAPYGSGGTGCGGMGGTGLYAWYNGPAVGPLPPGFTGPLRMPANVSATIVGMQSNEVSENAQLLECEGRPASLPRKGMLLRTRGRSSERTKAPTTPRIGPPPTCIAHRLPAPLQAQPSTSPATNRPAAATGPASTISPRSRGSLAPSGWADWRGGQVIASNLAGIAGSILIRYVIGPFCEHYGVRLALTALLVCSSLPGFLICRKWRGARAEGGTERSFGFFWAYCGRDSTRPATAACRPSESPLPVAWKPSCKPLQTAVCLDSGSDSGFDCDSGDRL